MKVTKIIALALIAISLFMGKAKAQGQNNVGIHFEKGLDWGQILNKAKAEHKYIFVDCYANWCVPCKWMEQNVYTLMAVGEIYNKDFICVKMQLDRTKADNDTVKSWYGVAEMMEKNYTINAYPAFLFFDPDGKPVHKATGSLQAEHFIQLATDAKNPNKQYYTLLKNFRPGKLDTTEEKGLINAFAGTDALLAGKIAADYLKRIPKRELGAFANGKLMYQFRDNPHVLAVALSWIKSNPIKENLRFMETLSSTPQIQAVAKGYIDGLSEDQIYNPEMLQFIATFTDKSKDRGFGIFYHHSDKVDATAKSKYFASDQIVKVISIEEFDPIFKEAKTADKEPDWKTLYQTIASKYDTTYARLLFINSRLGWFSYLAREKKVARFWPQYFNARIAKIETFRYDTVAAQEDFINRISWEEFFHYCIEKEQLLTAIKWMKRVVDNNSANTAYVDTYACLLYKSGITDKAIGLEQQCVQIAMAAKDQLTVDHSLMTIDKMKKREAIWEQKEFQ